MTEEQLQIQSLAREFAEGELRPHAEEWDRDAHFPREVIGSLGELGFLGMLIPEEWDGLGMDTTTYLTALEEIARGDASVAVAMSVHNSLPTQMILAHGSDAQKERWLRPMARGELLGGFALSEAEAGSDAAALAAQATRTDGGWVLNGAKAWITNGGFGDVMVVMARTDTPGDRRGAKGIGAFIVPTDAEGYIVGKKEDKMGQRASETVGIAFKELFVADDQLLGEPGMGFIYALQGLDNGRMGIAALATGIAQAALEHSLGYAAERKQFGTAVREFQGMQWKLANMAVRIEAARALTHRAAAAKDAGEPVSRLSSMAKLFASEAAMYVTTEAVQVHGGYGYVKEYPVERLFRDAKVTEIYEGTSEVQRTVIARELYRQ
ncbi:MAG: Acyl-CoA dehydrogenase, short-chain specific [uncultured Gemmatimonadetes bacterium]|uniref:Cyclohex-1-ene-1-carbonyl-CoA dehydrogenase n=1 Tax=uncultured Gemmatimonadota bacterium TaxID=203437 RepID=A0A6J4MLU9_9BACT|nr:MAG: Acyl-CoA dehydrogenase, short-chain specific [uncultured Gemmatimonadota bacterium]